MSKRVKPEIRKYIETEILPKYDSIGGHTSDHIERVIQRSLKFHEQAPELNVNMVYVIAAYHDLGRLVDQETHNIESAKMLRADKFLAEHFSADEINTMAEAVEDHRASLGHKPRSRYGELVSSADREVDFKTMLSRVYDYRKHLNPEMPEPELIEDARIHLRKKFGAGGYALKAMYFDDPDYLATSATVDFETEDPKRFYRTMRQHNHERGLYWADKLPVVECPRCGERLAKIIYGLPTPQLLEQNRRDGRITLGGCCVRPEEYYCRRCQIGFTKNLQTEIPGNRDLFAADMRKTKGVIVLTSCGVRDEKLRDAVWMSTTSHNPLDRKLLYVTTAADGEDGDKSWMDEEFATILKLGFRRQDIVEYKIGDELNAKDFCCMYLMGGNSYYLLDMIRKHHFDKVIRKFLDDGEVVIGSSAGSQVLGTSVKVSADENKIGMTDFTALGLVNSLIIPHVNQKPEFLREWREKTDERILALRDGGGVVIGGRGWIYLYD